LKSRNKILMWYPRLIHYTLVPRKSCPSYHYFYPQLVHAHTEQYHTDNLVLYRVRQKRLTIFEMK